MRVSSERGRPAGRRPRAAAAARAAIPAGAGLAAASCAALLKDGLGFTTPGPRGGNPPAAGEPADKGGNAAAALIAWGRASVRAAEGRSVGPAAAAAWHRTLRWLSVGLGIKVVVRRYRKIQWPPFSRTAVARDGDRAEGPKFTAADASEATRALQRLELPFFATTAKLAEYPMDGILIRGNLRGAAAAKPAWEPAAATAVADRLSAELGRECTVQLLRREDRPAAVGGPPQFELYVTPKEKVEASGIEASTYALYFATAAASVLCFQGLGSEDWQRVAGAVVQPGAALPMGMLFGLILMGEGCRIAVARSQRVELALPTLVPSPQLGLAGVYSRVESPPPSRAAAVRLALVSPLTVALASIMLIASGAFAGGGDVVSLRAGGHFAWPLALLPGECDSQLWAGAHGLLMASYALLPQSPDGRLIAQSLFGRQAAKQVCDAAAYAHPLLGILASAAGLGVGWATQPIWWAFVLINLVPSGKLATPLEEASEVPAADRAVACLAMACAAVYACPLPLLSAPPM